MFEQVIVAVAVAVIVAVAVVVVVAVAAVVAVVAVAARQFLHPRAPKSVSSERGAMC